MGSKATNDTSANSLDWKDIKHRAIKYLSANSWQTANNLLRQQLTVFNNDPESISNRIECLCLFIATCRRLGYDKLIKTAFDDLADVFTFHKSQNTSIDAQVLSTYCLAQRESLSGNYRKARTL